jgi:hypothetical protein
MLRSLVRLRELRHVAIRHALGHERLASFAALLLHALRRLLDLSTTTELSRNGQSKVAKVYKEKPSR